MARTDGLATFLGRSLLRSVAALVSVVVLLTVVGVGLLVGTNPNPRASGYVFFALLVAASGGILLAVLVVAETAVDLVGFVRDE